MNKRTLLQFCYENNIRRPRFSGKRKEVLLDSEANDAQKEHMMEIATNIGYNFAFVL